MRRLSFAVLLVAAMPYAQSEPATASEVTTLAGNGTAASTGDGGPASEATVSGPFGLVIGPDGALYVCETTGHRIRRIDLESGIVSTVAGNGTAGYAGDGGPATEALLKQPHSICFDGERRLYICDIGNHRVRRVDPQTGIITTFAGTGERKPTPDGAPIAGTPLNGPRALAFDGGESLYLALREGNALYRIDLTEGTLHHVAGTGRSGYSGDDGDARQAQLAGPKGVSITPDAIYLADTESHTIRSIDRKTNVIRTLVGTGTAGDGPDGDPLGCRLDRPHGVEATPDGTVYIGDSSNDRVRVLQPAE